MTEIHLIVKLSDRQKEYKKFAESILLTHEGILSFADVVKMSESERSALVALLDKEWNAVIDSELSRSARLETMKETVKLRRDLVSREFPKIVKEEEDEQPGTREQGADPDDVKTGMSSLTIEFPDAVRLEFQCDPDDVEDIKGMAQKLFDDGMSIVEIAKVVSMEFEKCTWEIESENEDGDRKVVKKDTDVKDDDKDDEKKVKESFADFLSGNFDNPTQTVQKNRRDKTVTEATVKRLERITAQIELLNTGIDEASPAAQKKLRVMVKESLESLGSLLIED